MQENQLHSTWTTRTISAGDFEIREQTRRIKLFHRGKYVAAFNDSMFRPYVYPFNTPLGVCPIHEASVDHPFHNGIFFGHRKIDDGQGNVTDCWVPAHSPSYSVSSGRIICRERTFKLLADSRIAFDERAEWLDSMAVSLIEQKTNFEFDCGDNVNALRIRTQLKALIKLTFMQTKEGLLGVRIADTFCVHNGGKIVDADGGVNEAGIMGKTSAWVDHQGHFADHTAGIAICQPRNRAAIPWFARDYGLITINQFREGGDLPLDAGQTYELDVLLAAHDGDHTNPELQKVLSR